ncbi:TonB-dependent receptor domain-containing protein [Spirabiliibacterium falconis]|uniref:TonB-dependent receptor domain-containing protein n=1 Tax=Spirabiliibacterium falconis TaxID=572023 RepID=UPI001AACDC00|nr:TonB-dependent receptor [Spirabiliibacterium falconis]MBE2894247.1 TonB-dependent receptor [Spirabiliibacterium falconis]
MQLNKIVSAVIFTCLTGYTLSAMAETVTALDTIEVVADKKTTEQQRYTRAGAVSTIGATDKKMQSLDSTIRSLPGTYTNINPTQGTVSVNIRGMTGFGRVNTMVDGVPQTFYGTSSNSGSKYHAGNDGEGYGPSSQYGVMIDPNFIVAATVERGFSTDGAHNINALNGSANFRTLDVDDIVFSGNRLGALAKFNVGNNGVGRGGMLALGGKTLLENNGHIGALAAYSGNSSKANYKSGAGTFSSDNDYVKRLDQRPRSWLAKVEWKANDDHFIKFSNNGYRNNVGGRDTEHDSYQLDYRYTPTSPWVDVKLLAAYSQNQQIYNDDANIWQIADAKTKNKSNYLDLSNKMAFDWLNTQNSLILGVNYLTNQYIKNGTGVNEDNYNYTPFAPSGKQKMHSLYATLQSNWQRFTLDSNLTYTQAETTGYKPACEEIECFPQGGASMKLTQKILKPSVMLSWQASDWFAPYISYAYTSRMPNLNEIFFNHQSGGSMNPFLKPERGHTFQIGFNTHKDNVFVKDDFLGLKVTAFQSNVRDFIYNQSFYVTTGGSKVTSLNNPNVVSHTQIYMNSLNTIKQRGIELDFNYDAGFAFARLDLSLIKSNEPIDVNSTVSTGFGTVGVTQLPTSYGSLELGGRLLDRTLTLGSIFKYTGKNQRLKPNGLTVDYAEGNDTLTQEMPKVPIIVDVYANYQINKHILLKASVQNLMNKNYVDALNSLNSTASQYSVDSNENDVFSFTNSARGRTFYLGAEVRF